MTAHDIVGGVVWVQITVLIAAMVFALFETGFLVTGQRRLFTTRRRLGFVACLSVLLLPLALPWLITMPWATDVNATDAVVAQYLKGNIKISAIEMNALVEMRSGWVNTVAAGGSWSAMAVLGVFFAAFVTRAFYLLLNALRIRHAVVRGHVLHDSTRTRVVLSPVVSVPFSTRGLRRYYIVLPQDLARDSAGLQIAMGHEAQHIRQGDVDAEVLLALSSPLFVLNPGYWFVSGRIRKLGELACDRAYLARQRFDAQSYALRLLTIARRGGAGHQPRAFGVPLVGRPLPWLGQRSLLKNRILEIAHDVERPKREARWVSVVVAALLLVSVVGTAVSLSKPGDWSHERIMLSTVVNLERTDYLNTLAQRSW